MPRQKMEKNLSTKDTRVVVTRANKFDNIVKAKIGKKKKPQ